MSNSDDDLANTFGSWSDEYLLEQAASGELTDEAQRVALRELGKRGIEPPTVMPRGQPDPQVDAEALAFVTVARFLRPTDAHILRGRLEAEGIPAMVTDANLVQTNNLIAIAVGGVRVQVPASFEVMANLVVAAVRHGEFILDEDWQTDDGNQEPGRHP